SRGLGDVYKRQHYYAPQTIEFNLERLSQVPSLEICLNQARNVSAFLKSESDSLFTVYCGGPSFGYYELHLGTLDKPSFTWQPSADTFNSYSDCEVHHESVLSHYAGSPATPLLGGYCSRNYQTEKYQVMIFKKRAK
ncbi:MAG: hypothetical protein EBZ49_04405, partial [Proteobacteria bacterium]|nr:hypothetical protein [Pseudomonadota bacterium]